MSASSEGSDFQDTSGFEHHFNGTERVFPAKLNCTAKRFIDIVLTGVARQLELAGITDTPSTSLSFHLDAGRSQPEGGGRDIPVAAEQVTLADRAAETNCTEAQVAACYKATRGLASLEGLGHYLVEALEGGVANPSHSSSFGWAPVAAPILGGTANLAAIQEESGARSGERPSVEVGGGSGAGFQIICDGKGLASAGGGGGGGASGVFGDLAEAAPSGKPRLGPKDSIGGGGGGGVQLFLPIEAEAEPWSNGRWKTWGSGGGQGCGSCGDHDAQCKALNTSLACGAKFDDKGAGPEDKALARGKAHEWRTSVLRRCYETGRLAVIGGGGGGAGGSGCCRTTPSLNFGFGFRAAFVPPPAEALTAGSSASSSSTSRATPSYKELDCCPDLAGWNITDAGQSTSGQGSSNLVARRLAEVHSMQSAADVAQKALGGSFMNAGTDLFNASIDPFAAERGHPEENIGGGNRRPTVQEMIRMHGERNGIVQTNRAELDGLNGPRCEMPAWLKASGDAEMPRAGGEAIESEEALRYIYRYNPLQGYLTEGAAKCGGWGDWCCLCHSAQRHIACLPDDELRRVDWFLTEDCCESSIQRNLSSNMLVLSDTPHRDTTVLWRPGEGWAAVPANPDGSVPSDSYAWDGDVGEDLKCPPVEGLLARPVSEAQNLPHPIARGASGFLREAPSSPRYEAVQEMAAPSIAVQRMTSEAADFAIAACILGAVLFMRAWQISKWAHPFQRCRRTRRSATDAEEFQMMPGSADGDVSAPYSLMIA
mmetsp:Transcript_354/g.1217  ORF Transcript_354/g.1217 Transcript_354/m.1217 type:complete len:768 (+) Transcript_354:51-2354(+)